MFAQLDVLTQASNEQLDALAHTIAEHVSASATIMKSDRTGVVLTAEVNVTLRIDLAPLAYGERVDVADRAAALLCKHGWDAWYAGGVITAFKRLSRTEPQQEIHEPSNEG